MYLTSLIVASNEGLCPIILVPTHVAAITCKLTIDSTIYELTNY